MKTGIKRVDWKMGQILLPHHLFAQEESILGHIGQILKSTGIPYYGVIKLRWDDDLFHQGIVSISDLAIIFPSGQLIEIPGNALPTSFDLNSAGKSEVSLYLHITDEKKQKEEEVALFDETVKVGFALHQIALSPNKNEEASRAVFKLAHFEKSQESVWSLSDQYTPPLLSTIAEPFLTSIFSNIMRVAKSVRRKIQREMESIELFAFQNIEWRLCLLELARLERHCESCLAGNITPHPYFLYEKLCRVLDCAGPEAQIPLYDHENLAALFPEMIHKIEYLFFNEQKDFSYLEFEREESSSRYFIDTIPPTLSKAKEAYLIVQKPNIESHFSSASLKLTSRKRQKFIESFFVSGITLVPIKKPAFLSSRFADEVEAFSIEQKEEWKKALAEGNLVLSHQDLTSDFNVFLYWRALDGVS